MNSEGNVDSCDRCYKSLMAQQKKRISELIPKGKQLPNLKLILGGKVNIVATGAGKDSNINIEGSGYFWQTRHDFDGRQSSKYQSSRTKPPRTQH